LTGEVAAATRLDEALLRRLVHRFYTNVRADAALGPIFDRRIADGEPHLEQMVAFWVDETSYSP
jgi:hemoglobin